MASMKCYAKMILRKIMFFLRRIETEFENRQKFVSGKEIKNIRILINIESSLEDTQIKRKRR